jgi:hypothetical protein
MEEYGRIKGLERNKIAWFHGGCSPTHINATSIYLSC